MNRACLIFFGTPLAGLTFASSTERETLLPPYHARFKCDYETLWLVLEADLIIGNPLQTRSFLFSDTSVDAPQFFLSNFGGQRNSRWVKSTLLLLLKFVIIFKKGMNIYSILFKNCQRKCLTISQQIITWMPYILYDMWQSEWQYVLSIWS